MQILFVAERDHWVATSYHQDEIRLYDSKCFPNIHDSLQEQIALIYREVANGNTLTVNAIPVQQQTGGDDCGLFSIAYSYHAALGEDLLGITFDQSKMRDHLIACLNQKCLKPFPPDLRRRGINRNKSISTLCAYASYQNHKIQMVFNATNVASGIISDV